MLRPLLIVSALLLVASLPWAQETKSASENKTAGTKAAGTQTAAPAYQPVPVAEARQSNPVKSTPESLASGKKIFAFDCALCHGAAGDGKTDVAKDMKVPNLTDPASLKGRTDGALFYRIKNGHGNMPSEGDRVKPEQLWDLVNYVRSLSEKKAAEEKPAQ
jgi:mono/diheme cytochrome c family protein